MNADVAMVVVLIVSFIAVLAMHVISVIASDRRRRK